MSVKAIKNIAVAGFISIAGLFSASAFAVSTASSTDLETLYNDGVPLEYGKIYIPGTSFEDTYNFKIDSSVNSVSVLTINADGAPLIDIADFTAELYDPTTDTHTVKTGSSEYSFSLSGPFDPLVAYSVTISGIVSGSLFGGYGVEITAVPLPAAAWLFISGFLAIGGWSAFRRKREQNQSMDSSALAV